MEIHTYFKQVKKHGVLCILMFLLPMMAFSVTSQPITLTSAMITQDVGAGGNAYKLIDEDINAGWTTTTGSFPARAYIDLGQIYTIHEIKIRDRNYSSGNFLIEYGNPIAGWDTLVLDFLTNGNQWNTHSSLNTKTRYLRITRLTSTSNASEIIVYKDATVPELIYDQISYQNPSDDPRMAMRIAEGTAPVPVGLYADAKIKQFYEPNGIFDSNGNPDTLSDAWQVSKSDYIHAIALAFTWNDLYPTDSDTLNFNENVFINTISQIDSACDALGKPRLPIFLDITIESLPDWMTKVADTSSNITDTLLSNKLEMKFYKRANGNGTDENIPVSTDLRYHQFLNNMLDSLSSWLAAYDPDGIKIPLLHYIGPAMNSNTMRVPQYLDLKFPALGDAVDTSWTKQKHISAFEKFAGLMGDKAGFGNRCWVFNYTNQAQVDDSAFYLTNSEQIRIEDSLKVNHPQGENAIIVKTESLCVNFDNVVVDSANTCNSFCICDTNYNNQNFNKWRYKMIYESSTIPYNHIANTKFRHGWEIWRSFNPKSTANGEKALSNYPLDSLIHNSLYINPYIAPNSDCQGTLWAEIWTTESREAFSSSKCRIDMGDADSTLYEGLKHWDTELRSQLVNCYESIPLRESYEATSPYQPKENKKEMETEIIKIWSNSNTIYIKALSEEKISQIEVYSLLGKKIYSSNSVTNTGDRFEASLANITSGIYIVKVSTPGNSISKKVWIENE